MTCKLANQGLVPCRGNCFHILCLHMMIHKTNSCHYFRLTHIFLRRRNPAPFAQSAVLRCIELGLFSRRPSRSPPGRQSRGRIQHLSFRWFNFSSGFFTCGQIGEWFQLARVVWSLVHIARRHPTDLRSISIFSFLVPFYVRKAITGQEAFAKASKFPLVSHLTGIRVPLSVIRFSSRHFK